MEEGKETFFDPKEIYEDKLHGDVLCPRGMMPHQIGMPLLTTDLTPVQFSRLHLMHNGSAAGSTQGAASISK